MHECSAGDPLGTAGVHQRMGQSGLGQELEDNPNVMSMMVHVIKYLFIYLGSPIMAGSTPQCVAPCQLLWAHNSPSIHEIHRPPHWGLRPLLFSNSVLRGFFNFPHFVYLYRMFTLTAKAPFFSYRSDFMSDLF